MFAGATARAGRLQVACLQHRFSTVRDEDAAEPPSWACAAAPA